MAFGLKKYKKEVKQELKIDSDLHSGRVEVEPESLLSTFISGKIDRQKFISKLIQEGERLEGTPVPENWPKRKIIFG
jgi:hypothetical protein